MNSIRKIVRIKPPRREPSLTKAGTVRKQYTVKNPRKKPTKLFSINVALTTYQKDFLEKKAQELDVKPTEVVRKILEVFCKNIVIVDDLSREFNICKIDKDFVDKDLPKS